ncbi:hypothetical protein J6590_029199 [Homalodisca vitripennis]|nr:hypothetical protein J6590_029199 [Homalodisca vitripennis]
MRNERAPLLPTWVAGLDLPSQPYTYFPTSPICMLVSPSIIPLTKPTVFKSRKPYSTVTSTLTFLAVHKARSQGERALLLLPRKAVKDETKG